MIAVLVHTLFQTKVRVQSVLMAVTVPMTRWFVSLVMNTTIDKLSGQNERHLGNVRLQMLLNHWQHVQKQQHTSGLTIRLRNSGRPVIGLTIDTIHSVATTDMVRCISTTMDIMDRAVHTKFVFVP